MASIEYPLINSHTLSIDAVCSKLAVDREVGLLNSEIGQRQTSFGRNIIEQKKQKNVFLIFLSQFASPMVYMLLAAAGLSFFFKEWLDGFAILIVIVVNAIIGFLMEFQAEKSMDTLKKMTEIRAKVIRDNKILEIPASEIVPGDILYVEAGDMIMADARLCNISKLKIDESALTGESMPVDKEECILEKDVSLADRLNMIYKGTYVSDGNARAIVTSTGMNTELGHIASMVQSADQAATPLEKKLEEFSKRLIKITVALVVVIFIAGVLYGDPVLEMLETSIALAVAAIPEGLPIVATLALANGMLKMARRNVIVKKLEAVETLGGTRVICTDKTGTLTQNKIVVNTIVTKEGAMELTIDTLNRKVNIVKAEISKNTEDYELIKRIVVLCNTAEFNSNGDDIEELGDPLEIGLLHFAYCDSVDISKYRNEFPKVEELPFSSDTRIMATKHENNGGVFIAVKGAAEEIIKRCRYLKDNTLQDFGVDDKIMWTRKAESMAASGLRMIGVAYRTNNVSGPALAEELTFVGLIGMMDPPREEVFEAIRECRSAGIAVAMITGDHPATAKNIAQKLGILDSVDEVAIHGKEMNDYEALSPEEKDKWSKARIFARVTPKQKLDLVTVLQEKKLVVGMTGDGVNDAPALKKADIGIAMGLRGTQVAQEVADMILKDDSFKSIVVAIKQGRIIFENIRKFVVFLLSCNISELLIVSVASVMNLHFNLFPIQILYINIVTDVLPALALGVTKGSDSIMRQPPRDSNEPIIDRKRWISIFVYSSVITVCSIGAVYFSHFTIHKTENWNPELCNNILFITLILSQLFHVFNMSIDNTKSFFKTEIFKNRYAWFAISICLLLTFGTYLVPPITKALSLYYPTMQDIFVVVGFSLLSLVINQILKRTKVIL